MDKQKLDKDKVNFLENLESAVAAGFAEMQELQESWRKQESVGWYSVEEDKQIHDEYLLWKKQFRKLAGIKYKHNLCAPQEFSIPMERHHVSKWEYVFIPKYIHQHVSHKLGDGKLEGVIG